MWYLYLDESGDMGFDFINKKPTKFFTVSILVVRSQENNRALSLAVRRTIKRKLKASKKLRRKKLELKGSSSIFAVKGYFFERVKAIPFEIYSLTLNKRRIYEKLAEEKSRVYNYIARLVLDQIHLQDAKVRVELILDKSKSKYEIEDFNQYVIRQLQGRLDPKVPLDIYHWESDETPGLQATDLFSWGIFRKYERHDEEWFRVFSGKVAYDKVYL